MWHLADSDRLRPIQINDNLLVCRVVASSLIPDRVDHDAVGVSWQDQLVIDERLREALPIAGAEELATRRHEQDVEARRLERVPVSCGFEIVFEALALLDDRYCEHKAIKADFTSELELEEGL